MDTMEVDNTMESLISEPPQLPEPVSEADPKVPESTVVPCEYLLSVSRMAFVICDRASTQQLNNHEKAFAISR